MPYKDPIDKKDNHKKYMREVWYPKNKKKHIGYQSNLKKKIFEFVKDFKRKSKCFDCNFLGKIYPEVLDFDHVKGVKKFELSSFHNHTNSMKRVREEINKCEIVCANCHRIRTLLRRKK